MARANAALRGPVAPVGDPGAWRNRIVGSGEEAPDQLVANPLNWRVHPGAQRDALRGSLGTVGWVQQVLVNQRTGHVVDGHARVEEALSRGEATVPVLYVDLDPDEEALVLATLDPISAMAATDDAKLRELLADLTVDDAGLAAMLEQLAPTEPKAGLTDPDDVPDLGEETHIKRGDLFALGDHRLMCGDATDAGDVGRLMDGAKADAVLTDPPYGVDVQERDMQQAEVRGRRKDGKGVTNDDLTGEPLRAFLAAAFAVAMADCRPGAAWYVFAPSGVDYRVPLNELEALGIARHGIVWVKDRFVMGRSDYHYRHENIIYGWVPGAAHRAVPSRDQDSVWEFARPARSPEHPTMKPVGLVERAMGNSSASGESILDPFAGSGTTIIAAEQLNRRCYAMEIDPRYVAVAIKRWEDFTGKTSERLDG